MDVVPPLGEFFLSGPPKGGTTRSRGAMTKRKATQQQTIVSNATLHFYAELNDFVPPARRDKAFVHSFRGRVSIKDMIESLGVPHTEVAAIVVNGQSQDFSYLVRDSDQIDVYPISIAEAV